MRCNRFSLIVLLAGVIAFPALGTERNPVPVYKLTGDTCLLPGQRFRLSGNYLGSQRQYDLELRVGRQLLKPAIETWQSGSVTATVPRKPGLSGQRGTIQLRERSSGKAVGKNLAVEFCATEEHRQQSVPASSATTGFAAIGIAMPAAPQMNRVDTAPLAGDESPSYESREVLVMSQDMDAARRLDVGSQALGFGVKRRRVLKQLGIVISVLRPPEGTSVSQALQQLQGIDRTLQLDANHRYRLSAVAEKESPAHRLVGWGPVTAHCGKGIRLGLIDTAVDTGHPSLASARIVSRSFLPIGARAAEPRHATAIASILVGQPGASRGVNGLMPGAELYSAAVFRQRGEETDTTAELIITALDWLQGQQVDAINISLAGGDNGLLELAVKQLLQRDQAMIAAAGNGGANAEPAYPAAWPGVVAVTAVDSRLNVYREANRGDYIDFAAPGVDVWAARAGADGAFNSGTSFAAPYVTAAVALSRRSTKSADKDWRQLQQQARDLGAPGRDPVFGYGLLQASHACRSNN